MRHSRRLSGVEVSMSIPWRVVVVDDDPKVRMLLERALKPPEFEPHSFPTGAAALREVERIQPHCVVSDILMPDLDGETLLRSMREIPGLEHVPFVACSAVRSEARIQSVLQAGADAFLVKPFPLRDLVERVQALVTRAAAERGEPEPVEPAPPPPAVSKPAAAGDSRSAPTLARIQPPPGPDPDGATLPSLRRMKVVLPSDGSAGGPRQLEMRPTQAVPGFGRFTRVDQGGRSFIVLTEATTQPRFTVTTIITEREVAIRRVESALPHPLAREEDAETINRQVDLQHDEVLRRLNDLVHRGSARRVVWTDQSRAVDAAPLAWALSAVAQLAESETSAEETVRLLQLTHERIVVEEDMLRAFEVTPLGRIVVSLDYGERLPRRAVGAAARWCLAFACEALQVDPDRAIEPIRHATAHRGAELERMGFFSRLRRWARG
jgi:CheY-like chemotaxis protein